MGPARGAGDHSPPRCRRGASDRAAGKWHNQLLLRRRQHAQHAAHLVGRLALAVHLQKLIQQVVKLCTGQGLNNAAPLLRCGRPCCSPRQPACLAQQAAQAARLLPQTQAAWHPCVLLCPSTPPRTRDVRKAADLLPLLLQVPDFILVILQGQVLKPAWGCRQGSQGGIQTEQAKREGRAAACSRAALGQRRLLRPAD